MSLERQRRGLEEAERWVGHQAMLEAGEGQEKSPWPLLCLLGGWLVVLGGGGWVWYLSGWAGWKLGVGIWIGGLVLLGIGALEWDLYCQKREEARREAQAKRLREELRERR